jgi:hypothetical protein
MQGTLLTVQRGILSSQFGDRTMPAGKMAVLDGTSIYTSAKNVI